MDSTQPEQQPGETRETSQQPADTPAKAALKMLDTGEVSDEVKARNRPSGTHYVEPSPLGIEPVIQTGVDKATNPPRSSEPAAHSAEVPLGSGQHAEPPGGGGRESQRQP